MKTTLPKDLNSTKKVSSFAKRSYQIYQEHFRSKNLTPALTLDEFMENYR